MAGKKSVPRHRAPAFAGPSQARCLSGQRWRSLWEAGDGKGDKTIGRAVRGPPRRLSDGSQSLFTICCALALLR
ncbi:hypothetical protein GCM10017624_36440 [Azotobacter vinelandii]|nr:hypothetical protein GCM10017624_36440 [Azotobacter vinelandii]